MWKLKLKACLINFLAYSLCTLFMCLCFHWHTPYKQDSKTVAIDYIYKQEEENLGGSSPSIIFQPDTLRFGLNAY